MQEQLLCVYICSNQWICRIYTAVEHVLLSDFQPRGQSGDTEQMQRPRTSSKHTAQTAEVDPFAVAEVNAPDALPRLCQQWHTSARCSSPSLPLTESERDKTASRRSRSQMLSSEALRRLPQRLIPASWSSLPDSFSAWLFLVPPCCLSPRRIKQQLKK